MLAWGANDVRFSPDGSYLSVVGNYPADTQEAGMALQIISTTSASLVHQVDFAGEQNFITGFDWSSNDRMIYATGSSSTGNIETGSFDKFKEGASSIDAKTGKIFGFSSSLGELDAVLNY